MTARHARPRGHLRTYVLAAVAAFLAAALATAIGTRLVTFDHLPGLAGVNIGTNTSYCSLDLTASAVTWSCETAR